MCPPEPQSLERVFRRFLHGVYLVGTVAFHVLPQSLLRSVGSKFLSLLGRMYCHYAVFVLSNSPRRPAHRHVRGKTLFPAMLAERSPPSHPGDGAVLHRTRRLYHFHSCFSHFYSPPGAGIFSRGTRRHHPMAIPAWHTARVNRRIRRDLVSDECQLA